MSDPVSNILEELSEKYPGRSYAVVSVDQRPCVTIRPEGASDSGRLVIGLPTVLRRLQLTTVLDVLCMDLQAPISRDDLAAPYAQIRADIEVQTTEFLKLRTAVLTVMTLLAGAGFEPPHSVIPAPRLWELSWVAANGGVTVFVGADAVQAVVNSIVHHRPLHNAVTLAVDVCVPLVPVLLDPTHPMAQA